MNVFQYLTTVTFLTEEGSSIETSTVKNTYFEEHKIRKIVVNFEKYQEQFGCREGSDVGSGELAKRYPGLFRDDIALSFHPTTSPDYARYHLALSMLSQYIHYYAEPRFDNDGGMLFSEQTGYEEAAKRRKPYVIMEDLS